MNKQKQTYEAPAAETLVVRFEGVICASQTGASGFSESGSITDRSGEDWGW